MNRLKICTLMGTRPEAIKLAPLVRAFEASGQIEQQLLITGQHRELLDQVLEVFDLRPTEDLRIMQPNQDLGALTSRALTLVGQWLDTHKPDCVVVQGDTTSAFAGALAAFYRKISVAHVEAGLRTDDIYNPFPEEANRRFIDAIATVFFAPTKVSAARLLREGVHPDAIHVTGNTGIDALLQIAATVGPAAHNGNGRKLLLVTAHRRESFGRELANICGALHDLVSRNDDVEVVYAVHPNPNVAGPVREALGKVNNIQIITPPAYPEFVGLMKRSYLILTDSGGIQEEAPSLGKPVLVLRAHTERVEAIEAGTAKLIGTNREQIVREAEELLHDDTMYRRMSQAQNPYGDGRASQRITKIILEMIGARLR